MSFQQCVHDSVRDIDELQCKMAVLQSVHRSVRELY